MTKPTKFLIMVLIAAVIILLALVVTGCAPMVEKNEIDDCEDVCKSNGGLKWVDTFLLNKTLCLCENGAEFSYKAKEDFKKERR